MTTPSHLLNVEDLVVHFTSRSLPPIRAVDGLCLSMSRGETLAVIGESGSGKSTLGRSVLGLQRPTAGRVEVDGEDIWGWSPRQRRVRRRSVQGIFQDPHEALDPRMTIQQSLTEPLRHALGHSAAHARRRVTELLEMVGLSQQMAERRPHELSGGQKQRVNIARALALSPQLMVCDEIVSALDVSIQADILNLLHDLQHANSTSYLFITHDLAVVGYIADRVVVMYLGVVVEDGPVDDVVEAPQHPYTRALRAAHPDPLPAALRHPKPPPLRGEVPSPAHPPSGCRFRTRCPEAQPICAETPPPTVEVSPGHVAACHFVRRPDPKPTITRGVPS